MWREMWMSEISRINSKGIHTAWKLGVTSELEAIKMETCILLKDLLAE